MGETVRAAAPWTVLAAVSAVTATIVVIAPEMGGTVVLVPTGAWIVLAIVRIVLIVGLTRRLYATLGAAAVSR